ncbi:MAG: TAT-variant-translocated molybdopterin oxidoreductase [Gemmatimonadetes bacterium]|nr:TAT-variant-translocated molybdopterin oxidoreductase [Gemmatimonadota bacterium]
MRQALDKTSGQQYWRSLDELAGSPAFEELIHREFPEQAAEWQDGTSRRNFLKLMGASLALGGLTNCTIQPEESIVPWVRAPENMLPGRPVFYASAAPLGGIGTGVLVESHMGRPTKIEGNPEHPASLGSTGATTQAQVLDLYDPDRAQAVTNAGRIATWGAFVKALSVEVGSARVNKGKGLRILTRRITSPTLGAQIQAFLADLPEARWHQYEASHTDNSRAGSIQAFGQATNTYHDLAAADVVLSLDADLFESGPAAVRYARDFMGRRTKQVRTGAKSDEALNRLYVVETSPTGTGSIADHRLGADNGRIEALAAELARQLGVETKGAAPSFFDEKGWLAPLVSDLKQHRGRSAVIVGEHQAPAVHALAHAINKALGNVGKTVHYTASLDAHSIDHTASLTELVNDMRAGEVSSLIMLDVNPVYDAPGDLGFAEAMESVRFRGQLSSHVDETTLRSHWHVPLSHWLEAWGDIRAYDGTVSIIQPLILPLYPSKSAHEVVAALSGQGGQPIRDLLADHWAKQDAFASATDFSSAWQRALHDGLIPGTSLPRLTPELQKIKLESGFGLPLDSEEGIQVVLRPDPFLHDGRFANNGWLQETPRPVTKLTWDNAALVSPATAERLGVSNEQVLNLTAGGRELSLPTWILPGQAAGVITIHLGYGREQAGRVGTGIGANAAKLRSTDSSWTLNDVTVSKSFDKMPLACTQDHQSMEGRHLVRHGNVDEYRHHPDFAQREGHQFPAGLTLLDDHDYTSPNQWGMVIDLTACTGCNACSVACQSENNIPIVGKEQVLNGREMSWVRIDRYFTDLDDPEILHQPVPCQQCENAPCEVVCPVTATSHSEEGLNDMVYNRCVGTRYCSNNCPYKVRRFNFLQYVDRESESLKMQRNPDVTVRPRGVMEKCTYCVQRLNAARVDAKVANGVGAVAEGAVQTSCQQACPTQAIAFGNIADPKSEVAQLKASPLNYGILTDLNTRPRTTYLARVKNPNPEIS